MAEKVKPNDAIQITQVEWAKQKDPLRNIRKMVFIEEQGVSQQEEWDGIDELDHTKHFLAYATGNPEPIGCARLQADGKIGRMAVLRAYRNQGVGSQLLTRVLEAALIQGSSPYLYAQIRTKDFYLSHGFEPIGNIFDDAGIPHIRMFYGDIHGDTL